VNNIEGSLNGDGAKIAIVVGRFNSFIGEKLLDGAVDGLVRHGVKDEDIDVYRVPGAFEIPFVANKLAHRTKGKYNAIICLGCVIRGATPHFEYVSSEVSKGVAQVMMDSGIPVSFGVLTVDTIEQAIERAGTKSGNKGFDAAVSAIEMINLDKKL